MGPNSFPWVHDSDGGYPPVNDLQEAIERFTEIWCAVEDIRDSLQLTDFREFPAEGPEEFIDLGTP